MDPLDDPPAAHDDRRERERARRSDAPLGDDDLRARVQRVALRQQQFEKHVAAALAVDAPGLEAMDHLISTGPATPTELARRLGISTAAMTLVLHRLENAGHIRRERHPHDGRKLVVTPVDGSRDRARELVTPLIEGVETVVRAMDTAERATVQRFLDRLIDAYDDALDHSGA